MHTPNSNGSRTRLSIYLALAVLGFAGMAQNTADPPAVETGPEFEDKVLVLKVSLDDLGNDQRFTDFRDLLAEALDRGVSAIVFDVNIHGSSPWLTYQRLLEELPKLTVPTFAFANPSALGSGAVLAAGTDAIYLSPAGVIGGAGLFASADGDKSSEEAFRRNYAQQLSVIKARARSLAAAKGHDPKIIEAFIDSEIEVKRGDEVISPAGEVLTLTAEEATREFDGKPLIAKGVVQSVEELLEAEGIMDETLTILPQEFAREKSRNQLRGSGRDRAKTADKDGEKGGDGLFSKRKQGSYTGKIVRIKIGMDALATGEAMFDFIDRTLKKAELDEALAVVFDMDTPGGYAWYTQGLVLNGLQNVGVPTITFVNTRAESAGAILAIGTDHIYMRPAATIGSALVVSGTGGDLAERMEDKITEDLKSMVENMAVLKGHNPDVAIAFVTQDHEVAIDGIVIHESGNVLNLNTLEATRIIGGRPVLAKGIANTIEDIVEAEGLEGEVVDAQAYGMESFAHWVQKFSFLLIILGLAGAYMELQAPGFGVPGVVSLLSFGLFFFGNNLAGNLAGYELAVLLVLGLVLIGVEIFVLPGTLIPGITGAALVIISLGMAMIDKIDFKYKWEGLPGAASWGDLFSSAAVTLSIGILGSVGLILAAMRYLPESRMGSWLVLKEALHEGAALDASGPVVESGSAAGTTPISFVGLEGETTTDLRPAGKGQFEGRLLDIISDGEFVEAGTPVRVVTHEGPRIVVVPLKA